VKRVADGETDLMATLEDLGRLNVRVVTTGNATLAKNALGKELSTKDYQTFIDAARKVQGPKDDPAKKSSKSKKTAKQKAKAPAAPSASSEDEVDALYDSDDEDTARAVRDSTPGHLVESAPPNVHGVIVCINNIYDQDQGGYTKSVRDRLLKVQWNDWNLSDLQSRKHSVTQDKLCERCKVTSDGKAMSKLGNGVPNFKTHKTITCVHEDLLHIIGANLHGELTESQSRRIMYALHPLQGAKPWQDDLARNEKATKDYKDWRLANPRNRRNNNDKDW
jgi:hypothetical protein